MLKPCSVVASVWFQFRIRARGRAVARGRAALRWAALGLACCGAPAALAEGAFTVTSKDLQPGQPLGNAFVYDKSGCHGLNHSPQLQWSGEPPGTKSFAVTMFDIDAPGPGWWHWAVAGIPASVHALPAQASGSNRLKQMGAIEARNDYDDDASGYGGPCPPPGKPHRYVITVYALDTTDLRLAAGRPAMMFEHEIGTATLAKAGITITYGR